MGIAYGTDLNKVTDVLNTLLNDNVNMLKTPPHYHKKIRNKKILSFDPGFSFNKKPVF